MDSQQKLNVTLDEYRSIFIKAGDVISKNDMVNLVGEFAKHTIDSGITTKSSNSLKVVNIEPFSVVSKSQSTDDVSSSLYSVVAVDAKGDSTSTLISADARLPMVLAHTNGGKNLNAKETPEAVKLLLNAALKSYNDKLAMANEWRDSIKSATVSRISSESAIPEADLTQIARQAPRLQGGEG